MQTGSIIDRPKARAPKKLTDAHYVFVDSALEKGDELTTRKLHHLLVEKFPNRDVPNSTVKWARRELGWVSSKVYTRKNVQAGMNAFLHNEYKPHNLESLKDGIRAFWKTLTPEKCQRYINHMHTVFSEGNRKRRSSQWILNFIIHLYLYLLLTCSCHYSPAVVSIPRLKNYGGGYALFIIHLN